MKKNRKFLSQERLREIAWEVGAKYPTPLTGDHITLLTVNPRRGFVHWQIRKESVEALKVTHGEGFNGAHMVVRIYDVTDILFDGFNAHMFFDLGVNGLSGNYYFSMDRLARSYLADIGFRFGDGSFHCLARSNTTFFDRDRPSGDYQAAGLFVGGTLNRSFSIENIFDAPVYERMNIENNSISEDHLSALEQMDNIFPNADYRLFRKMRENSNKIDSIYRNIPLDEIPWNVEVPPDAIVELVESGIVKPCRTIDLGCGTGNCAIYLSDRGFDVTGIDSSPTAIKIAQESAKKKGAKCTFIISDILSNLNEVKGTFDFAYDWEVLHHIFPENRNKYLENVHRIMNYPAASRGVSK